MGLVREIEPATSPAPLPATDVLIARLGAAEPEHRRESALELEGVRAAIPGLLARVGVEAEPVVRDAVLTTLAAFDSAEVANGLAVHLSSDHAPLRIAVAQALSAMPGQVQALIPRLIGDPDHNVRIMAAMVLSNVQHPQVPAWLCEVIQSDPHPNVVAAALDAFLPAATKQDIELLAGAGARFARDPFLTFAVATAIARLDEAGP